jgi:hypothetical protein
MALEEDELGIENVYRDAWMSRTLRAAFLPPSRETEHTSNSGVAGLVPIRIASLHLMS